MPEQETTGNEGETQASLFRAAQYVRMSTEHQQYSTENQADKIREYAARRNIEIVRTYADEGKSGLRINGRQALQQLIADVQSGKADFQIILVYDVSRWGRFQDADESAYYEYICRRAGIQVAYCAEQFENDGSPVSTIVKGVKRAMAGEYSRELSAKVFAGQCRLIELGCEYVLLAGTHTPAVQVLNDLYGAAGRIQRQAWARLPGPYYGAGSTLAAAVGACLAHGLAVPDAVREAQEFTWRALAAGFRPGMGRLIPDRFFWARRGARDENDTSAPETEA